MFRSNSWKGWSGEGILSVINIFKSPDVPRISFPLSNSRASHDLKNLMDERGLGAFTNLATTDSALGG